MNLRADETALLVREDSFLKREAAIGLLYLTDDILHQRAGVARRHILGCSHLARTLGTRLQETSSGVERGNSERTNWTDEICEKELPLGGGDGDLWENMRTQHG